MPWDFLLAPFRPTPPAPDTIRIGSQAVCIDYIRSGRSRRYILRLRPDGSVRATVPRAGSVSEARKFAERNSDWIAKQLQKRAQQPPPPRNWGPGTEILFRGEKVPLTVGAQHDRHVVQFADQLVRAPATDNFRGVIERHLRWLAERELPPRTRELAAAHQLTVQRITVRNQRSRWGSCSQRGTLSLNWRLIQTPDFVRDYIIVHELMHLREMNHSNRFWDLVARNYPRYEEAEAWLKTNRQLLR